jgi:putative transposase
MDNGRFHKALLLDWADHVMPIYLPAYSPELNPIERLWEHTKKDLKWENSSSLDKLKEQVNRMALLSLWCKMYLIIHLPL